MLDRGNLLPWSVEVIGALGGMAESELEQLRWLELLSYLHAMVYHDRGESERRELQGMVEDSVRTDPLRQDVRSMERTIAEALRDEGARSGITRSPANPVAAIARTFWRCPRIDTCRDRSVPECQEARWLARPSASRRDAGGGRHSAAFVSAGSLAKWANDPGTPFRYRPDRTPTGDN
jgi:hypothetical protein